jgi:hypothetical protein
MKSAETLFITITAVLSTFSATAVEAKDFQAEPKTEAAVLAASDDWLAAERRGDVAALDRRLMPEYQDITSSGQVHPRSALIAHAANLKDPSTMPAKQLAAEFRKAHPVVEKVIITRDTAVLSYHSADSQTEDEVRSIDVFVYDQGRWRALVSTHNAHG